MATNSSFADNFYQTANYIYNNFILHKRINSFTTKKHDFITSRIAYLTEECAVVLTWEGEHETVYYTPKILERLYIKI
jgi:hypothetical protein